MRMLLFVLSTGAVLGLGAAGCGSSQPSLAQGADHGSVDKTPFACNRRALTEEERKRHFREQGPALLVMTKSVRELPNGYEFEFSPDAATVKKVAAWAADERVCCPFFDIDLHLQHDGGPLWLRLTGREDVKQFIQTEAAQWIRK